MSFVERGPSEHLAEHLLRNADALALTRDQQSRLRRALALSVGAKEDQREAHRLAWAVSRELGDDLVVVVKAIEARGEKVVKFNDAGARRVRARDGLASLHASSSLTDADVQAGMAFRLVHEALTRDLSGSSMERQGGSANWASAAALHRSYMLARLNQFERAVAKADRTGRALLVLRHVAGEGTPIDRLASGGDAKRAMREALILALREVRAILDQGVRR